MWRSYRPALVAFLALLATQAWSDQAQIHVNFFPTVSVADSHSTIDVSAEVRDSSGKIVVAGTQVLFTTTLGTFRSATVTTTQGVAHATLIAGSNAGIATITVSALGVDSNPTVINYEFVGTRAELQSAKEYVEIAAPGYMQYANNLKLIGAAAPNRGVSLHYRDIQIQADDLQYDINTYTVVAHHAHYTVGKLSKDFELLYFVLNTRKGYGTTSMDATSPEAMSVASGVPVFLDQTDAGDYTVAKPKERFGLVNIFRDNLTYSLSGIASAAFDLVDISTSPSTVSAKRATIFPRKGIQFQSAELYVANAKLIKLPLFVLNFNDGGNSPLVTDGIISLNDNQFGFNYPQYLILRPGLTSDLRFHMGDRYGRGLGSDRGAFLDYELNWNKGDDLDGGLTVGGIGRDDWEVDAHQYWRIDPLTSANAQVSVPTGQGLYASGAMSHQFVGFSGQLNADHSQTFTGITSQSQSYGASLMTDPRKVGSLPLRYSYGVTSSETMDDDEVLGRREQDGRGVSTTFQSDAIPLDRLSTLTTNWQVAKLYGSDVSRTLTVLGTVNISRKINKNANLLFTYNFTQDGFNDVALGRHMLTMQGNYHAGNTQLNLLASKSLGVERVNVYGDASYSLSKLWRLTYNYTSEVYREDNFLDYNIGFGYRIGWREVGLTWSYATKRIGFQLLGAQF